jgi:hypothetical protein
VGDYDERTKLYGAGFGGIHEHCLRVKVGRLALALKLEDERSAEPEKGYCRGREACGN